MGGVLFMYMGIQDVAFVQSIKELIKTGQAPAGAVKSSATTPPEISLKKTSSASGEAGSGLNLGSGNTGGGTALGKRIAETALKYKGVPYKWGGTTPTGWDCSGFVYYVLNQVGIKVPRLVASAYATWPGAAPISRSDVGAGDLMVWPNVVGHIGIAISNTQMIHAPTFGQPTKVAAIPGGGVARRVKG
jgi:cell wall-associated NlpC family hydrolase